MIKIRTFFQNMTWLVALEKRPFHLNFECIFVLLRWTIPDVGHNTADPEYVIRTNSQSKRILRGNQSFFVLPKFESAPGFKRGKKK